MLRVICQLPFCFSDVQSRPRRPARGRVPTSETYRPNLSRCADKRATAGTASAGVGSRPPPLLTEEEPCPPAIPSRSGLLLDRTVHLRCRTAPRVLRRALRLDRRALRPGVRRLRQLPPRRRADRRHDAQRRQRRRSGRVEHLPGGCRRQGRLGRRAGRGWAGAAWNRCRWAAGLDGAAGRPGRRRDRDVAARDAPRLRPVRGARGAGVARAAHPRLRGHAGLLRDRVRLADQRHERHRRLPLHHHESTASPTPA